MNERFEMPDNLREAPPEAQGPRTSSTARKKRLWWFLVLLWVIGMAVTAIVILREPTEPLDLRAVQAAREKWRAAGIADYDVRLVIHAARVETSEYAVQVRGGLVVELMRNGRAAESGRPADFTVDGLFDTLEREYDLARDPSQPFNVPAEQVLMRVRFNDKFGYLERYVRGVGGRSMEIETLAFQPIRSAED